MVALKRVHPGEDLGFRRWRAGSGFRYVDADGASVPDEVAERIRALVIPPAWTDVWICADESGHIQATGVDEAGRTQYLYHPDWARRRDRGKFARALRLAAALPAARARVTTSLRRDGLDRERVLAAAFRMLDTVAPRVGSERYFARHGSRGLATLLRRDAAVDGNTVTFRFPGKSGAAQALSVVDIDLAAIVAELAVGRGRSPLLAYRTGRRRVALSTREINDYVRSVTGGRFTAKDFRTLRGTILAAEALAQIGPQEDPADRTRAIVLAVKATAAGLGNTPAVARGSYIDPRVLRRYRDGEVLNTSISAESAIRDLLGA